MSMQKGARYERELVNNLREDDWFAMRLAASGAGADAELPDIIGANEGSIYVIELKFTSSNRISVKRDKLQGLKWLASQMGATPLIAARFSGDTSFYFYPPGFCKQNEKSVTVGKDDRERAMRLGE